MPEDKPVSSVVKKTLLALLAEVPGGGTVAGFLQATADAASRQRDEDWWAMVSARLTSLEVEVQERISFSDPEFVAAAHRITRAAQETADDEKRERLAAALAHAGSWSSLPVDDRERMERLVVELSSREINLLKIVADPKWWLEEVDAGAIAIYESKPMGSFQEFLDGHVSGGVLRDKAAVRSALEALQARLLIGSFSPSTVITGSGILDGRAAPLGWELIHYLGAIGA